MHPPRIFDPAGLTLPDGAPEDHPTVRELRELVWWTATASAARARRRCLPA